MNQDYEHAKDIQIRKNIQQTYLLKLQDITQHLRKLEKEHLLKVKNLYGEEGEIFLNELERKEQDFLADDNKDLIQMEHMHEQ